MRGSGKISFGECAEAMKIITLTLNPAFDMHCLTDEFRPERENFFEILSEDAGGKGINISRALNSFNVANTAIVVVGKENGEEYCKKLGQSSVNYVPIFVNGRIRENIILHDKTEKETRVSFNGFTVSEELFPEVVGEIEKIADGDTIITVTGSNPKGVNVAQVKTFVSELQKKGAKVVIDNRSFTLADILEIKPFLIKPNREEISAFTGREFSSREEILSTAKLLHEKGVENVLISLGKDGAILACDEGEYTLSAPKVPVISTIGAGDSMIAGFIYANICGKTKKECHKYSVAFGTSACKQKGTLPPDRADTDNIYSML